MMKRARAEAKILSHRENLRFLHGCAGFGRSRKKFSESIPKSLVFSSVLVYNQNADGVRTFV